MKREWKRPYAMAEEFRANEYVAACWGVACDTSKANEIEKYYQNTYAGHSAKFCGQFDHQYLQDDNNDGIFDRMTEIKQTINGADLPCTVYTNANYNKVLDLSKTKFNAGDTIYWMTTDKDGINYHHVGTVKSVNPNRPNVS